MAICNDCKKDMSHENTITCSFTRIQIGGKKYNRNIEYHDFNDRCHDCNIVNGNYHHFGCDMERCPVCDDQIICCDCEKEYLLP